MQFPAAKWEEVSPAGDWDEKRHRLLRSTAVSISIFRRRRYPLLTLTSFLLATILYVHHFKPFAPPPRNARPSSRGQFDGTWNYTRDARNLMLSEAQCHQAFPNFYLEIDRAVEDRRSNHVTLKETDEISKDRGYIRAMIYDQELYVIDATEDVNTRGLASLHALHRAILTSPEPLPNIEFTMLVADTAESASPRWVYTRERSMTSLWLMPDFGYWSWPEPKVGSYGEVQMRAEQMDARLPWSRKIDKLIWRGASMDLLVREQLVNASEGKDWSDVKFLVWQDNALGKTHDVLKMDGHCEFKFVAHTEGVSYSARLQNLQNCRSVIVAHKLKWLQHHHHLMKSSGPDQNFVEVASDFANLDAVMQGLLGRGKSGELAAEKIAANNVRTFRERYLTPAAEVCYWRQLVRGWASVSFEPEFFRANTGTREEWRGVPVESFMLMRQVSWEYQ
ncbi:hypothetical protein PZA11_006716 [Diplocarpon coronariae]|uniref:Glycosyl transferase CAP10 domain-containing protein n=1 Tax=Diplocarpon coronariae TaxID=2795749 RepID=A0A218YV61_9HELO|nr:hypothetical protein B2J93_9437 [Marssonina coronariae]